MSNQGQKALAGQVHALRQETAKLKGMNFRLNNEIRKLQSVQLSMMEPHFFKALRRWFVKWYKYRKA